MVAPSFDSPCGHERNYQYLGGRPHLHGPDRATSMADQTRPRTTAWSEARVRVTRALKKVSPGRHMYMYEIETIESHGCPGWDRTRLARAQKGTSWLAFSQLTNRLTI
jgi:hypothetical protein